MLLANVLIPRGVQAQTATAGVFSTLQTDLVPDISLALEPATMRSRVVQVDTAQVTAARFGRETLRLNLFDDEAVAVQINRVRPTRAGYFITGRPQGFEWGEVRLVVNGPVMAGRVVTPEGEYTIRFGGASRHVIRQVDPSREILQDDVVESPLPSSPPQAITPGDPLGAVVRPATDEVQDQATEDGTEVRVLIAYTPALQARQGGAAGMQALIDLMIESANLAFEISGIDTRLVLAHSTMVNYIEENSATELQRLRVPDDGYMDEVHALRNEHAADLVHLLTVYVGGPSGISRLIENESLDQADSAAFSVTANGSEVVFTHEIGHHFGVVHDRFSDLAAATPIYPYAFGYVNNGAFESGAPETARWRTVMAYGRRCTPVGYFCPRLLRFANPDQSWLGHPLGVPADDPRTGIDGPADARLTINKTARWVGSYRSEACTQYAISPEAPVAPVDGGEIVLRVETGRGCLWDVSSQSGFLTPESDARQAGTGFFSLTVEPSESGEERIGTVSVAGTTVQIRQLATEAGICGRTPSVVRAIAPDLSCDEVTDQHLGQVTSLLMADQGLRVLKTGDFEGLSNLVSLSLNDNRFTELPVGLFAGLSNLNSLRLDNNRFTELPAGLFAGLSNLVSLRLNDNRFTQLPAGLFAGLSKLQILVLSRNDLSELSAGTFAGLSALRELHFDSNPYTTLPTDLFSGLTDLERLYLYGGQLTDLPDGIFADLSNLDILELQGNCLAQLSPGVFRGLSRLHSLFISDNELTSLPEAVFSDLTALKFLVLGDNQLSNLPDGIFSGLTTLEVLELGRNQVDPLRLGISLERVGDNQLKAVAPTGAPYALELPLTVSSGGEVGGGANSITIPAGAVESAPLSATRVEMVTAVATVDIASLPSLPEKHSGYVFEVDAALPIELALPQDVAPPAQVTGVEVTRGAKSLQVSWTPITGTDGYKVQWKSGDEDYDDESRQAVVAGGDTVGYTITGLMDGTGYTVRVLATRAGADDGPFSDEVGATTRSGDPDVNGDGVLDGDDAQIMYYASRFPSLVGDGETGGTEALRQRFLAGYSGLSDPSDEDLRGMVAKAATWREEGLDEGGDINVDGMIDGSDARAMNYAYRYESLLGDGDEGGAARFRLQLLGPLAGKADPTDEELKAMLRRANELREAYSQ